MWQSVFTNKQTVLLQCLGNVLFEMFIFSFIIEKITLCIVLSLYDKNRFIFTIYYIFVLLCIPGTCAFHNSWEKIFFSPFVINNQCGILRKVFTIRAVDYERIINYGWPYLRL